MSIRTSLKDT